jgi:hypothetical protein
MKTIRILAALLFALLSVDAFAASKLFISEYGTISPNAPQAAVEPAVTDQAAVDFSAGAAQSAAFNTATRIVRLMCDTRCAVKFGSNPTATTANKPLAADAPEYFFVTPGDKVSVIASP